MKTLQHAALFTLCISSFKDWEQKLNNDISWFLLPDAITLYVPRQVSHFETSPPNKDVSFIAFPTSSELEKLTYENFKETVFFHIGEFSASAVPNPIDLSLFEKFNSDHIKSAPLRAHLSQDVIRDSIITTMVDSKVYLADSYKINHSDEMVDGSTIKAQIENFENLAFIDLIGRVYKTKGILLNQNWFNNKVYPALIKTYSRELADYTLENLLKIDSETNYRINNLEFELTDSEKKSVILTNNLQDVIDSLYCKAFWKTYNDLASSL